MLFGLNRFIHKIRHLNSLFSVTQATSESKILLGQKAIIFTVYTDFYISIYSKEFFWELCCKRAESTVIHEDPRPVVALLPFISLLPWDCSEKAKLL